MEEISDAEREERQKWRTFARAWVKAEYPGHCPCLICIEVIASRDWAFGFHETRPPDVVLRSVVRLHVQAPNQWTRAHRP